MATLHLDFGDGFRQDDVIVRVGGQEVARKSALTTDLRISSAGSMEVSVPVRSTTLQIEVPKQGIVSSVQVNPAETPYAVVMVVNGKVEFYKSEKPIPKL
jgi:hypothetical protein